MSQSWWQQQVGTSFYLAFLLENKYIQEAEETSMMSEHSIELESNRDTRWYISYPYLQSSHLGQIICMQQQTDVIH